MNETAVTTTKAKPPIVVMRERFYARADELKAMLTDVSVEAFIRAIITAATINPEIQACTWNSLWNAALRACRDQLLPDGRQGAIVAYKDKAQWQAMYQGLLLRAWRTGKIKWIGAYVVHEGDLWAHHIDSTGEHFRHEPKGSTAGKMIGVYAAATTIDGGTFVAFLPKDEADKIRDESKARREDSPWHKWPGEMYKKTALRRLAKMLPIDLALEDEDVDEAPARLPRGRPRERRPEGATAALESFAGEPEPEQRVDENDSPPLLETINGAAARQAYERGRLDKSNGVLRKACPGEYRTDNHLAMSWLRGWNGELFIAEESQ
jgi:recombination protein RecT